jgi:hypothetical protein
LFGDFNIARYFSCAGAASTDASRVFALFNLSSFHRVLSYCCSDRGIDSPCGSPSGAIARPFGSSKIALSNQLRQLRILVGTPPLLHVWT